MDFDPKKNYYDILWVSETASTDEIKKAFRKLAIKHHPDRWGSKEKFQEINEAYQVLSDEKKRWQYDAFRKWWFTGGFWWWQWGFDFGNFGWFWSWGVDIQTSVSQIPLSRENPVLWGSGAGRHSHHAQDELGQPF